MARSSNQKLKPLYIMRYLLQSSDEDHPVTVNQIIGHLESLGIPAERKSIYSDLEALQVFGLDIVRVDSGRFSGYYVAGRVFELPELKLLVDSVQSSKFITHKKTAALIKKIGSLTSVHQAQLLNRQVFVTNRLKAGNEAIYYNVDEIYNAITGNRKIQFLYFEYDVRREKRYRHSGEFYVVSPFAMTWDDENYYMVAYDSSAEMIKHYRVDKMDRISMLEEARDGMEVYSAIDMAAYAKKTFGMFTGSEVRVELRFENRLVGAVMDRLGREVPIAADGPDHFTVRTDVAVSPQFFAWVLGFGGSAEITAPAEVVQQIKEHIEAAAAKYR